MRSIFLLLSMDLLYNTRTIEGLQEMIPSKGHSQKYGCRATRRCGSVDASGGCGGGGADIGAEGRPHSAQGHGALMQCAEASTQHPRPHWPHSWPHSQFLNTSETWEMSDKFSRLQNGRFPGFYRMKYRSRRPASLLPMKDARNGLLQGALTTQTWVQMRGCPHTTQGRGALTQRARAGALTWAVYRVQGS